MIPPIDLLDTSFGIGLLLGAPSGALLAALGVGAYMRRRHTRDTVADAPAPADEDASVQLERLIAMGRALGSALDPAALRDVFLRYLPALAGGRHAWMITRTADGWDTAVSKGTEVHADIATLVDRLTHSARGEEALVEVDTYGALLDDNLCLPMLVGETAVGVVGVRNEPPIGLAGHSVLSAAIAMLAIAIRNNQLLAQTRESSIRDGLTGCFNRTYAIDALSTELRRASRSGCPLAVLMFDIDQFKAVNDRYGHLVGDAMLASIGTRLGALLRGSDVRCRYGGDEFLLILPDTPPAGARRVADIVARAVSELVVETKDGPISPAISIGVASADDGELEPTRVIGSADDALYGAKREGRSRFAAAPVAVAH